MNKDKLFALVFAALVLTSLYFLTPIQDYLSPSGFSSFKAWLVNQGPFAPVVFVLVYFAATILCLPGSLLTLAAGALFGVGPGLFFVFLGSNLGANGAFFVSRYFGRELVLRLLRKKASFLETKIEKHGFNAILVLRLLPIVPFNVLNYACGLAPIRWLDYFGATTLGMIPGIFIYVSLGNAVTKIDLTDPRAWTRPEVWGPFVLVILLAVITNVLKKDKRRKHEHR